MYALNLFSFFFFFNSLKTPKVYTPETLRYITDLYIIIYRVTVRLLVCSLSLTLVFLSLSLSASDSVETTAVRLIIVLLKCAKGKKKTIK